MTEPRSESGRWTTDNAGVDDIARADRFLDTLADGQPVRADDPGDRVLATLLAGWRDELRSPPIAGTLADPPQVRDLRSAHRRRSHPGLIVLGSAAATLIALGGFAGVVSQSQQGDALYGMRSVLFGESGSTADEQIMLSATSEMDRVRQMIARAQWDQARQQLTSLGETVRTVNDAERRQTLVEQLNRLYAQVQQRDSNATAPDGPPASTPPNGGDSPPG